MKEIQSFLVKFGFTNNAAKAYTALLRNSPSTGYEISSQTDIPRSAIYNVLNRLVSQGYANSVGDSPKRYIPLQPSALMELLNQSHNEKLDGLGEAINNIEIDVNAPYVAEMVRAKMYEKYGEEAYTKGYDVFTTVKGNLQKKANESLIKSIESYDSRHGYRIPEKKIEAKFFLNSNLQIFDPIKPVPPVTKKVFFFIIINFYIFFLTSFEPFFNQVVLKP